MVRPRQSLFPGGPFLLLGDTLRLLLIGLGPHGTVVALVLIFGAWLYAAYGPQAPDLPPVRQQVGQTLVAKAAQQFPWDRDVGTVLLLPVENDWGTFLTDTLRARIQQGGRFQISPESALRRMLNDLRIYPSPTWDEDRVQRILRSMTEDTLLIARLRSYEEDHRSARGELNCVFIQKATGTVIPINVETEYRKSAFRLQHLLVRARLSTVGQRIFMWFIIVLVFPILVLPITLGVTRLQSALASLVMILAYSTLLIIISVLLLGPLYRWWQGLLMVLVSSVVILYLLFTSESIAAISGQSRGGQPAKTGKGGAA